MQCHVRPARPRDMQRHMRPMPCAPFFAFVKHSAHFLCMHALEYSAPGVGLCAEIVSRWSAYQGLSGMVRVSDVPHWTKSTGTIPPLAWSVCLNELQVCVRMRMRVGVCGYACACARPALDAYRCFQEWWRICRRFMPSLTQAAGMQPP
jgi:hypothetical protein